MDFALFVINDRKYLGLPASSCPCERLFSAAGNLFTQKRAALDDDLAEKIILIHENIDYVRTVLAAKA